MNIFVTGASGFLGRVLVNRLIEQGHVVSPLVRRLEDEAMFADRGCLPVKGSLEDIDAWSGQLHGCDVLIHCAAPLVFWGPWSLYQKGIVDATDQLYRAASKANIKRFIYISSEAVLQGNQPLLDIDESVPYMEPNSYYGLAKQNAEKTLLENQQGAEVIILRPTFIWGEGSPGLRDIIRKVTSKQFVWIDKGEQSFEAVHVENVVAAILCALTKGADKSIYYITDDEQSTVHDFIGRLLQAKGFSVPEKSMPSFLIMPLVTVLEKIWQWLRLSFPPPATRFSASFIALPRRYNIAKAKTELGYRPVISREQGLALLEANSREGL